MAPITMIEGIRQAMFEEMDRDPAVVAIGEDIGVYGGAFKATEGLLAKIWPRARDRNADQRDGDRGRGVRDEFSGAAAGGGNAVHRFHRLLLQPGDEFRREVALSLGRAGADGDSRAFGRRRARRAVSFGESGNVFRAHAGVKGGLSVNAVTMPRAAEVRDSRQ